MNRHGTALPLVMAGLLAISMMTLAGYAVARLRWLESESSLRSTAARLAATGEVERAVAQWDPTLADTLAVGQGAAIPGRARGRGVSTYDSLIRLGPDLFLVRSVGQRGDAGGSVLARAEVGRLVRIARPIVADSQAVLSAAGPVRIEGSPTVDGSDQTPPGWEGSCPPATGAGIGIRLGAGASAIVTCPAGSCLIGAPPILVDTQVNRSTAVAMGPISLAELLAGADLEVGEAVSGVGPVEPAGRCDRESNLNWGNPGSATTPCGSYFPVVAARPGTRVSGGAGQGILASLGSLELSGGFAFHGLVVAGGSVTLRERARVHGTVVARDSVSVLDQAAVLRSVCAVTRSLERAGRPSVPVDRAWSFWP